MIFFSIDSIAQEIGFSEIYMCCSKASYLFLSFSYFSSLSIVVVSARSCRDPQDLVLVNQRLLVSSMLNTEHVRTLRRRWVDDLHLVKLTSRPLPIQGKNEIQSIMESMHQAAGLKIEVETFLVGFEPFFSRGRIQFSITSREMAQMKKWAGLIL